MCWEIFSRQTLMRIHQIFWRICNYHYATTPINPKHWQPNTFSNISTEHIIFRTDRSQTMQKYDDDAGKNPSYDTMWLFHSLTH